MSQVRQRPNITEFATIDATQITPSIALPQVISTSLPAGLAQDINALISSTAVASTRSAPIVTTAKVSVNSTSATSNVAQANTVVKSPVALRNQVQSEFRTAVKELTKVHGEAKAQQVAAIQVIQNLDYRVENAAPIVARVKEIVAASSATSVQRAFVKTLEILEKEHTRVYTTSVANVIQKVAANIGFANARVTYETGKIAVTAMNGNGQALLTEIKTDPKTTAVNLVVQTIGIEDNSCDGILNTYDQELEAAGLKFRKGDVRYTNGVPHGDMAKLIANSLSQSKTKATTNKARRHAKKNHTKA